MMSKKESSLRLFVGVYPPTGVSAILVATLDQLGLPPHRVTPPVQVHLTLQFIGDTPVSDLDHTMETVRRATAGLGAFSLAPRRLIALPRRGAARLVAAETDAPATLLELQRRLASRLARQPRRRPGDRFLPHLTLCRFRTPTRVVGIDRALELEPFDVDHITLMKSTLHPDGARHEVIESVMFNR